MFGFAVDRDIVPSTPCTGVKPPGKEVRRYRILTDAEISTFWHGLDKARMTDHVRLALKLQLATAQRRGEVVEAPWSEFDLEKKLWVISADRAKNGIAHSVPLNDLALALLAEARPLSDGKGWLFPSPRKPEQPIAKTLVNHTLSLNQRVVGVDDLRPHDLRRSAASQMTAMGIPRLVVSKILNHSDRSVTAIYDRHSYDQEKRHALDAWGKRLGEIVVGIAEQANVVELAAAQ